MEPHTLLLEMSPLEQIEPMPGHGIAPGGCFPAPSHLPMLPSHPDWVLDLISDYLPWGGPMPVEPMPVEPMPGGPMPGGPMPVEPMPFEPMPFEPYGTPV